MPFCYIFAHKEENRVGLDFFNTTENVNRINDETQQNFYLKYFSEK